MKRYCSFLILAASASFSQSIQPGLVAEYSDGRTRVATVTAAPRFYLNANESIHPSLAPAFEAEWKGLISIVQAGEYTFETDALQLNLDGRLVGPGPLKLSAGRHPVTIRYRRTPGAVAVRLQWKSSNFPMEPVPGSVFFHDKSNEPDARVEQGRMLAEELGCVNCHSGSESLKGRMGPDLTGIGSRANPAWLPKWLETPQSFRSGAVMPGLDDMQKRLDIATYLASLQMPAGSQRQRRIRGGDVGVGGSLFGSIGCAACHQQPGLSLDGMGSKMAAPVLAEYLKDPAKTDPSGRMPSLMLTDNEANQLAAYLTDSHNPRFEQPFNGGDPVRGRTLVESEGCLACHALQNSANRQSAPRLERLTPDRGCLAAQPDFAKVPHYRLRADERSSLSAFLTSYKSHPDVSRAPIHAFETKLRQLRCAACHELDGFGPTAVISEATPPLTDVGEKLRTSWLEQVLIKRARSRAWQTLRMPDYDVRHALALATEFAQSAGVAPGDGQAAPQSGAAQQARGAGLIGTDPRTQGMACIGCHDWGKNKSLGEHGPQLIDVTDRLRYDWYYRWMLNPARILSGTSMPSYFTSMDRTRAGQTIHTLWAGMSLGARMPLPAGLGKIDAGDDPEAKPVPGKRPIIVRWDMPEATPAAIAVGLPEKLSYCFDAGESRMRYAWSGGFIDLSETLAKKTDENRMTPTAKVIGKIFYRSQGFPIRIGQSDRVPERRFRGYRLTDGYPEFRYQVDGIEVAEKILPSKDGSGLDRNFTVARVDRPMWFVDENTSQKLEIARGENVKFSVHVGATK